jgi:glycosyltransferase involved in cell wall biosynthesis
VTAISASIRSELLAVGVPGDRIRDVPNGVDACRIQSIPVDRNAVRREMDWPLDRSVLLTMGRNHPKKGYRFIPRIIKRLVQVRQDFLWVIVGRGAEPIMEMAHALGVGEYLRIVRQIGPSRARGNQDQLAVPTSEVVRLYKTADIFVSPTLLEGFALVLVEAMAAGLPVVTTDAAGARDAVTHNATGLISPVRDTLGMTENILKLLGNRALADELGRNGERVARGYEWRGVASRYCSVYEEAIRASTGGES